MQQLLTPAIVSVSLLCTCVVASQADGEQDPPAQTEGILHLPDYSGDLLERNFLLGDFRGSRDSLAEKGVQFYIDWTQYLQSIVDGGRDETTRYGGAIDFNLTLDLHRMDVMPGALISMRAESRYGNSVNGAAGPLLPVNTDAFFPLTSEADEDIALTVTALNYTQFLSHQFAVFLGKIEILDGDLNEFASGRGMTQFQNSAFIFNSVGVIAPYSTLAVGALWLPNPHVTVTTSIMNAADSSTTSGFSDFGDGWNWAVEAQFQYQLGGLPGGQNVGGLYSTDREFLQLNRRLVFEPGVGLSVPTKDESWFVNWSGWQYLWTEEEAGDAPMDLRNRVPDLQGFGLFARVGFADQDTIPIEWSASGGVGGRGIIPGRDDDIFGLGYFYTKINAPRLTGAGVIDDYSQGFEAFYNIAITPSASLTLDVQVVEDAFPGTDTATILGARLQLRF